MSLVRFVCAGLLGLGAANCPPRGGGENKGPLNHPMEEGPRDRKVLVIYTGGTLGMKELADGSLGTDDYFLGQHLPTMQELKLPSMPSLYLKQLSPLLDSSEMKPRDWQTIACAVEQNYTSYDGFVVVHGTDTMTYTGSALPLLLPNLKKPLVVTGSQVPIAFPTTDATKNLVGAMLAAQTLECAQTVCIYFHDQLLQGNHSTKSHTEKHDGFQSPNFEPLMRVSIAPTARSLEKTARLGIMEVDGVPKEVDVAKPVFANSSKAASIDDVVAAFALMPKVDLLKKSTFLEPKLELFREPMDGNVMVVQLGPTNSSQFLLDLVKNSVKSKTEKPVDAIIFNAFGAGNAPSRDSEFMAVIAWLLENEVLVVFSTQCYAGAVNLRIYASGMAFAQRGVLGSGGMSKEATYVKLQYLLAKHRGSKSAYANIKREFEEDIKGEMTGTKK